MFSSWKKRLFRKARREQCPECGHEVKESFCDVCGYDLIRQTQDRTFHRNVV